MKQRYRLSKLLSIFVFLCSCYTGSGISDTGKKPLSDVTNELGMQFVLIPAGTFSMGSSLLDRGGSMNDFARFCWSANRIRYMPFDHTNDLGFRLVMEP